MKFQTIASFGVLISLFVGVGCGPKAMPESPASEEATAESPSTGEVSTEETSTGETATGSSTTGPALGSAGETEEDSAAVALPSLGEKLAAFSAKGKEMMPAETLQAFKDGIEEVRGTGIVESALNVGDKAVDGELPDAKGNQVKLSELWAKGPVVVVWYRGGWCPYCNLQLQAMQEALPAIKAAGATLVAITPETPDNSLTTSEKNKLDFVVLSDVGNKIAEAYGVVFKLPAPVSPIYKQFGIDLVKSNGDESDELPLAATYVIDQTGTIRYAFLDADYTKRAEPAAVVEALKSL